MSDPSRRHHDPRDSSSGSDDPKHVVPNPGQETVELTSLDGRDTEGPPHDTAVFSGPRSTEAKSAAVDPEATIDPVASVAQEEEQAAGRGHDSAATVDPDESRSPARAPMQDLQSGPEAGVLPTMDVVPGAGGSDFSLDPALRQRARGKRSARLPEVEGYELLAELGRGGMGVVYRARHQGLNRQVALKMILSGGHAGAEQLARFRAEAEAVAQLKHPNIVQIYDVGEQEGLPYFSLEYVDGRSLDAEIDGQPQQPVRAAELVEMLARAMHHAHQQGIIHRDLKPGNVLLTADGVPKITDFGLVKRIEGDSTQTRTGTIMGTPSYMAPEQGRGDKNVGPLADVYALGSILYCLLTGRPPFLAATPWDTLMQLLREEPVPPSRLQSKIPADLETISLKCLQKDGQKRYATAEALADDLRRYLNGEPISARPVGKAERAWRWCKRNPRIAIPSAAAAVLALAVMIGGPVAAVVVYQQKELAVQAQDQAEKNAQKARHAQGEAETAQALATRHAQEAEEQRQLALTTLHGVLTGVEEKLRDRPDMRDIRKQILEIAASGLKDVKRSVENAALADRSVGAMHQRMGDLMLSAGETEAAVQQLELALAIFEQLIDQDADNELAKWNAALTHDGLGDASRQMGQDAAVAREHYLKSLAYRQDLYEHNTNPLLQPARLTGGLINSFGRLGNVELLVLGNPEAAKQYYEQALEKSLAIYQQASNNPIAVQGLGGAHYVLARAQAELGELQEARDHYEEALEIRQALKQVASDNVKVNDDLAASRAALGDLELQSGNHQAALEQYQQAHDIRQQMKDKDPTSPIMRFHLSDTHYQLGVVQQALGMTEEAEKHFQEALALREAVAAEDSDNIQVGLSLLAARARCGQHSEASELARQLEEKVYPDPGTLVALASGYALCAAAANSDTDASASSPPSDSDALAQQYADAALEKLQQAVRAGFQSPVLLKTHPDLAPIRHDPRFQVLLSQTETQLAER